jgi:hypothetical protein
MPHYTPDTNFEKKGALANLLRPVRLVDLKFLKRTLRLLCGNFKSAALFLERPC